MRLLTYLPNVLTCLNLFLGSIAIVFAFDGQLHISAFLVIIAAVLDFLDGFTARWLKAYSDMGKQLDSLADLISFGLAPAVIVYSYMHLVAPEWGLHIFGKNTLPFLAFLITVFSALRLAKFNIDERQSESFIGLPTPANALFFISFPLIHRYSEDHTISYIIFDRLVSGFTFLVLITTLFSLLLISNLPLFSLKFKSWGFASNRIRYIFVGIAVLLIIWAGFVAIPFIIINYIMLSVFSYSAKTKQ